MTPRKRALGTLLVVLAGGVACTVDPQRAWQERRLELDALALPSSQVRLCWELEFEALNERSLASAIFSELVNSPHRANLAWSWADPRPLDELQRQWLDALWSELTGLEDILAAIRSLPLEELGWHGECPKMMLTREITHALCARAWLALEDQDVPAAILAWTDALRLARALDDGSTWGTIIRGISELIVLDSVRSGLALGAPAALVRAELLPFYQEWGEVAVRGERAIRRDLSLLARAEDEGELEGPEETLEFCGGVEDALARTHEPAQEFFREGESHLRRIRANPWIMIVDHLHMLHARRNVAFTAIAVAAHREQHGAFPATLAEIAELESELKIDPRSGEELPYELSDSRARIGPPTMDTGSGDAPGLDVWILE